MRRLPLLAAALLAGAAALSACGGSDNKDPGVAPAVPDVAANFNGPIDARGADPAWGLKIRGLQFTVDRPNQPTLTGTAPGAVIDAHSASWTVTLADKQTMKVSLYASRCTDRASGATYPFSAEVILPSGSLNGCAGKPAAAAKP